MAAVGTKKTLMSVFPSSSWASAASLGTAIVLGLSCSCVTRDWAVVVSGVVLAETGVPMAGVEVELKTKYEVFRATEALTSASAVTEQDGSFSFAFNSHRRQVPYQLFCRRIGYEVAEVSGVSPPAQTYRINLRKARP
jgi:hypothetical protein